MKKYFVKGTDEEVQFGDVVDLEWTRHNGKRLEIHRSQQEFVPELVDILLKKGILEEREVEEEEDILGKLDCSENVKAILNDHEEMIEYLIESLDKLEEKQKQQDKKIEAIITALSTRK